jgi:hypothetical protein
MAKLVRALGADPSGHCPKTIERRRANRINKSAVANNLFNFSPPQSAVKRVGGNIYSAPHMNRDYFIQHYKGEIQTANSMDRIFIKKKKAHRAEE